MRESVPAAVSCQGPRSREKIRGQPAEQRSSILKYQWYSGLGDVFLETGEPQLAITHLEAALAHTDQPALRQNVEKKLAQARGASGK
jgi:hypothetical protein